VDLCATAVGTIVLELPPATAWSSRTQTLSVLGSPEGGTFGAPAGSKAYTFDPASGNTVTIPLTNASARYVRVALTGNTVWPAGQISEFEVYAS
jgi:hypothetical protein